LLRPIDEEEGREEAGARVNYDESEDEDVDLRDQVIPPSAVLPIDQDDEVDLHSEELTEILAESPISRVKKSKESERAGGKDVVDDEEAGGVFELSDWV
jgi:hypothetical protein